MGDVPEDAWDEEDDEDLGQIWDEDDDIYLDDDDDDWFEEDDL
jgi:hypothetical protein